MTQCRLCENVSLILCFLKCCAAMPRRNTSQRAPQPKPPEDMSDRLRLGRPSPTNSARREKQAVLAPLTGRGRRGARDLLELMLRED